MSDESLVAFEQKSLSLVPVNQSFPTKELSARIPSSWIHVVIVDDFLASFPNGEARICELMGLNEIGDPVTDLNVCIPFQEVRVRFQKNMSKAQAKKVLLLSLRKAHVDINLQQGKENLEPNIQPFVLHFDGQNSNVLLEI